MNARLNNLAPILVLAAAGTVASAQPEVPLETVVSTADNLGFAPSSGSLNGTQTWLKRYNSAFQSTAPTIDGNGNVAFTAVLTAGVGTPPVVGGPFDSGVGYNQFTVWHGGPGALTLQARYGDATLDNANCGGAGAVFTSRGSATLPTSPSGYMALLAYGISGGSVTTSVNANVIWSGQAGDFHNLVRADDVFLNVGNSHEWSHPTSENGDTLRFNDLGQTCFTGWNKANTGDTGAYGTNDTFMGVVSTGVDAVPGQNGRVRSVVRLGTTGQLAGVPSANTVRAFFRPGFNHSGSLFNVYGMATGVGDVDAGGNNDYVLVMSTDTGSAFTNTVIGREGGPTGVGAIEYAAQPTTGGMLGGPQSCFATVTGQSFNNAGRAVWVANLKQGVGGITSANDAAYMTYKNGVTSIIAQKGDNFFGFGALALGAQANAIYRLALSNSDQVVWIGTVAGAGVTILNDQFLAVSTIADDGSVTHRLILREGDQVPDRAPGLLWGGDAGSNDFTNPTQIAINASGIVVFSCRLTGTGITTSTPLSRGNDLSSWAWYPGCGTFRLISRTWDVVGGLTLNGQYAATAWNDRPNGEGSTIGFNDQGWLAFLAMDGQGTPPAGDGAIMRLHFCTADLDDGSGTGVPDGGVDINDLLYFLAQYESGICGADLDGGAGNGLPDGGVDINDLLFFLAHYEGGC